MYFLPVGIVKFQPLTDLLCPLKNGFFIQRHGLAVCLTQASANEERGNPLQQAKKKKNEKKKKVWHDLCGCVQFFRLGSYFWAEGIPL